MRDQLLKWQWETYPLNHTNKTNLLIHIVAVPVFIASTISVVTCLASGFYMGALYAALGMLVAFAAQGAGHKRESVPPIPFEGALDAPSRIFVEQFVTFPRFVLSGRWLAALRSSKA